MKISAMKISVGVCLCCFLFFLITLCVFIGLSTQNSKPNCYLDDFYAPALNTHINLNATTGANFLFFDLRLENVMSGNGVLYDTVNLTISYGLNQSTNLPVAEYRVAGFYQGHKKTAHRRAVVPTRGVDWDGAFATVLNGSKVVFRVDLATKVKFKKFLWGYAGSAVQELFMGANVEVDDSGNKVQPKAIKLKPGRHDRPKLLPEEARGSISSF